VDREIHQMHAGVGAVAGACGAAMASLFSYEPVTPDFEAARARGQRQGQVYRLLDVISERDSEIASLREEIAILERHLRRLHA